MLAAYACEGEPEGLGYQGMLARLPCSVPRRRGCSERKSGARPVQTVGRCCASLQAPAALCRLPKCRKSACLQTHKLRPLHQAALQLRCRTPSKACSGMLRVSAFNGWAAWLWSASARAARRTAGPASGAGSRPCCQAHGPAKRASVRLGAQPLACAAAASGDCSAARRQTAAALAHWQRGAPSDWHRARIWKHALLTLQSVARAGGTRRLQASGHTPLWKLCSN